MASLVQTLLEQPIQSPRRKAERRCPFCERSFAKREHLDRHVRSHIKEKPFVCRLCGKKYSRHDTLLRHRKVHTERPLTDSESDELETDVAQGNGASEQLHTLDTEQHLLNSTEGAFSQTNGSDSQPFSSVGQESMVPVPTYGGFADSPRTNFDDIGKNLEAHFSPWFVDGDIYAGLFDTPIMASMASMAEIGSSWPNNMQATLEPERILQPADIRQLWFTRITRYHESRPGSTPPTPVLTQNAVDEDYRQTLSQRLEIRPNHLQHGLPSAEFLNLCIRAYFARFHPIFPVVHAPTFRPSKANSMLLLSICSVGSLFTGSAHAIEHGMEIFEHLHKAVLSNWERLIAKGTEEHLSLVQTALIGQTFGLLSGEAKHLALVEAFHGTVISLNRRLQRFSSEAGTSVGSHSNLEQRWRTWARKEEHNRIGLALQIHDAELANIFYHEPFLRHEKHSPTCHGAFMAGRADKWEQHYRNEIVEPSISTLASASSPNILDHALIPATQCFSAYAILQGITVDIVEHHIHGELGERHVIDVQNRLIAFQERFQTHPSSPDAHRLQLPILWHVAFMTLLADFDLLERAVGREGTHLSAEDKIAVTNWANSDYAKRCVIHGALVQRDIETMPLGSEPAMHVPRALFRAGIAWFCYTHYGHDTPIDTQRSPESLDFPELKIFGLNPALLLFEVNGHRNGRPTALEANGALGEMADLLRRIGHWEIARKFAVILQALITMNS